MKGLISDPNVLLVYTSPPPLFGPPSEPLELLSRPLLLLTESSIIIKLMDKAMAKLGDASRPPSLTSAVSFLLDAAAADAQTSELNMCHQPEAHARPLG